MEIQKLELKTNIDDVVKYIEKIFEDAVIAWASDIHVEPTKDFVLIRFRLDWSFMLYDKIAVDQYSPLLTRLKILSTIKIDESRIPQDWKIVYTHKLSEEDEDIDIRVSTLPTNMWEKVVMRILRQDSSILGLDKLKFLDVNLEKVKETLKTKYWIILVAWPTGSWKSTTLFSLLKNFNPLEKNISTLEDPVEYNIDFINQSQIAPQKWFTFASGLRSLLRQDPDIIMVWEMRDKETSTLATEAALTWHLVLSTIHTNSAPWTIQRLLNMWIEPFLIGSALKMIISQRLVRKVCPHCKVAHTLDEDLSKKVWKILNWVIDWDIENMHFHKWEWCEKCNNTGYKWRLWIHEILVMSTNLENAILSWATESELKRIAIEEWMITIVQDALIKSLMWETSVEEALLLL